METMKQNDKKEIIWLQWILSAIAAGCYLMVFSTTSPVWKQPRIGDTLIFQVIGKYWTEGVLPYVGIWDHKGPLLFFLNAAGYFLTGSKEGVFLIQTLFLTVSIYLSFRFFRERFSKKASVGLLLVMYISMVPIYQTNTTEEYCLPFLVYCFWQTYKWGENAQAGKYQFPPAAGFIVGLSGAVSLLTRAINALGIAIAVIIIAVTLAAKKEWKNLLWNGLACLAGFCVLTVPFFAYFASKHAIADLWYGMIEYNIIYARAPVEASYNLFGTIHLMTYYLNALVLAIAGVYCLLVKKIYKAVLYITIGAVEFFWLVKSALFSHYAMLILPFFCLIALEIKDQMKRGTTKKSGGKTFWGLMLAGFLFFHAVNGLYSAVPWYIMKLPGRVQDNQEAKDEEELRARELIREIPKEGKDSFIAYNVMTGMYLYLEEDICPAFRFFTTQEWWIRHGDEDFREMFLEEFKQCEAEWILVSRIDDNPLTIEEFLTTEYELTDEKKSELSYGSRLELYRRRHF